MASEKPDQSVYLIISFDVQPQWRSEFEEIMQGVKVAMKGEAGFENAKVYLDVDVPDRFVLIERWRTKDLHRDHYDRIVASGDWMHILGMLKTEPTMRYTQLFAH